MIVSAARWTLVYPHGYVTLILHTHPQRYLMQVARAMLTSPHYPWNFKYITVSSLLTPGTELHSKTLLVHETGVVWVGPDLSSSVLVYLQWGSAWHKGQLLLCSFSHRDQMRMENMLEKEVGLLSHANCANGCCSMGGEKGAESWSDSPARGQHSRCTLEEGEKVCKTLIHICCL